METGLEATKQFWNRSPCGGQTSLLTRQWQRYGVEPWLPAILGSIAKAHSSVVEVGCGQGTDGLFLCSVLPLGAKYLGFDYSDASVKSAKKAALEAQGLAVSPKFFIGDAEAVALRENSAECVYSMGVLHHTPDEYAAIAEVFRILKPGGKAYIILYRKWSPKVAVAKLLRAVQELFDTLLGTDRCLYRLSYGRHAERVFGTMILECFGVPYMKWYSRHEMEEMFSAFRVTTLRSVGYNIPWLHRRKREGWSHFGYFWYVEAQKDVRFGAIAH